MRLATWNLERGGKTNAAQESQKALLHDLSADVAVFTEPPASYQASTGKVMSLPGCYGQWVAIVGKSVEPIELHIPYDRTAVAARVSINGITVIIYGTVLPWTAVTKHAPELVRKGEDSFATFKRVLAEQANDITTLRRQGVPVVWMGDFNQSVSGPNWGGSNERRDLLNRTLISLEMVAWNGEAAHAKSGMQAIDLICGPQNQSLGASGRIDPVLGNVTMSDHAGYWIDLVANQ